MHADMRLRFLEVAPHAIEQILVRIVGIDLQAIDIDKVRLVDRIGPAEIAIVPMQHEGRAGEEAARHVPAFLTVQHRFIPGDRTGVGLM